jgi:hypothetical protein
MVVIVQGGGEHLVGRRAVACLQRGLTLLEVRLFGEQRVVGPVQVVDEEGERRGIDPDQASHHLRLAANLNRGHRGDQQRDHPDADRSSRRPPPRRPPRSG